MIATERAVVVAAIVLLMLGDRFCCVACRTRADDVAWFVQRAAHLRSLWIGSLGPLPDDPSNAYDTDPRAAALGRRIFFDTRFSSNGALACVTCHPPASSFQDAKPTAVGLGPLPRRSMPLLGVAYNTWFFWDGRKDSLWSQAATPMENPLELGLTRDDVATAGRRASSAKSTGRSSAPCRREPRTEAATRARLRQRRQVARRVRAYDRAGAGPIRRLCRARARRAGRERERDARAGGAARCSASSSDGRTAPTVTRVRSSRTGSSISRAYPKSRADTGRSAAIALVTGRRAELLGAYSDAAPDQCSALRFIDPDTRDTLRAFKTPTSATSAPARPT